jgi:hypothetical protein
MASQLWERLRNTTNAALTRREKKAVARDNKAQANARVNAKVTNMGIVAADTKTGQLVSARMLQRAVIPLCFANAEVRKNAFVHAVGSSLSLDALYAKNPELESLADETILGPESMLPELFIVELFNVLRLPKGNIDAVHNRIRFLNETNLNPTGNKGHLAEAYILFDSDLETTFGMNKKLLKLLQADRTVLFFAATCLLQKNAVAVIAATRSGQYADEEGRAQILKLLKRHDGCMWNIRPTDTPDILDRRMNAAQSWYALLKYLGSGDAAYVVASPAEVMDGSVDPYTAETEDGVAPPPPPRTAAAATPGEEDDSSYESGAAESSENLSGFDEGTEEDSQVETTDTTTVKTVSAADGNETSVERTTEQTVTVPAVEAAAEQAEQAASRIAAGICANSCDYHQRYNPSAMLTLCPEACINSRIGAALKEGRTTHKGKNRSAHDHMHAQRRTIESMTRDMPKAQRAVMRNRGVRPETLRPYDDSRDFAEAMYSMIGLEYKVASASEQRAQDLVLIDQLAAAVGRSTAPIGVRAAIYAATYGMRDPRDALALAPIGLSVAESQKAVEFKKKHTAPGLKELQIIAALMGQ